MKFIDYAKIIVKSGDGGKGHISFRREKFVPKGGPDGGNGGKGGNIVLKADPNMTTLLDFRYKKNYEAQNGENGGKAKCTGQNGKDLIIRVPCGTLIKDNNDESIYDLVTANEEYIVADGGKGGRGNAEFATATNQAPRYAQPGIPGIEMEITLELKLLADVGIVGFPNVGKSTLISVISDAKPKIADYPFTTLIPNLGMVRIEDYKSFTVADIPGLIEGASSGKGLGIQFLRHVERCRALIFMIDCQNPEPEKEYQILINELAVYNPDMANRQRIICLSKTDTIDNDEKKKLGKLKIGGIPVMLISSVSGESIKELKFKSWDVIKKPDA